MPTEREWAETVYACEHDPIFCIFNHFFTYDAETGTKKLFAAGYPEAYRNKLKTFILEVLDVIRKGRGEFRFPDFHNLKSRQTYQSWTMAAIETYAYLFIPNFACLITTDGDSDLDNANHMDYNTKLGKIGYITYNLDPHLKPKQSDILRSHNLISYTVMNSVIKGDCSMYPGMGGQINLHDGDEWAAQRFQNIKLAAMREAIKGANVLNSTPKGKLNTFYDIWLITKTTPEKSSFRLNTWHWKEKIDPKDWAKFWADALRRYQGDLGQINQELELSFEGISVKGRVFTSFIASKHVVDLAPKDINNHSIFAAAWDYGVGAPTVYGIGCIRGKDIIMLDAYHESGSTPKKMADKFKADCQKWGVPFHAVKCVGDPSGNSQPRESQDYDSSVKLFRDQGIYIQDGNPRKLEGIQAINGEFYLGNLYVNKRCGFLIDALNEAVFPVNQDGDITKDEYKCPHPLIDYLDMFKYFVRYMVYMTHPGRGVPDKRYTSTNIGSSAPDPVEMMTDK